MDAMRIRAPNLERVIAAWLAGLVAMLVAVLITRDQALDGLAKDVTTGLTQCYSTGRVDHSVYTGGWKTPSLQGSAIYLLERGRRYPQMERGLLITEALRSYDWKYYYRYCWNYDLRMLLIDRCQKRFPDDAEVAWAAGRLLLTAGHYSEAVDELERAIQLGLDYGKPWIHPEHVQGRIIEGLLRAGRVAEWEYYLLSQANSDWQDEGKAYRYINALLIQGKYDQALQEIDNRKAAFSSPKGYSRLAGRALFWSGRRKDFAQFISAGNREGTLDQKTKVWASKLEKVKPPDVKVVVLLEELEALTTQLEELDKKYYEVYERSGWRAASSLSDQRRKVRETAISFEVSVIQADFYAFSNDQEYIEPLLDLMDGLVLIYDSKDRYSSLYETRRIWDETHSYLGRCFVMAHQWDSLIELYQMSKGSDNLSSLTGSHQLLAVLASGKPFAEEYKAQDYFRSITVSPSLIASAEFQSALTYSGRDFAEVLAEVQERTRPFRGRYYDYSNGDLKIRWVKLAETDNYNWRD